MLPVEFPDLRLEALEVGALGRILGPAAADDGGQFVGRAVKLFQRRPQRRFGPLLHLLVHLCTTHTRTHMQS